MESEFRELTHKPFARYSKPGSSPGTLTNAPAEPKPEIRVLAYSQGELFEQKVDTVAEAKDLVGRYSVTWIDVEGLGDVEVIREFGEAFGLHPLALEDVVHVHQRPKVEEYDEHLFIIARMIDSYESLQTEQIAFFLGKDFVLTIQEGKPGDCLDPVRQRIRSSSGKIRKRGTDYLTYALLDSIVDHYFPVIESYGARLDQLDDHQIGNNSDISLSEIHQLRRELLVLRKAVRPYLEAINQLLRDSHPLVSDDTRVFLRDCYDHTLQLNDAIDVYREVCTDLRDYHLSMVSTRTNDVMKILTIIATLFIPLGFIAGLYGMNFDHMPELHWTYGYPMAIGLMSLVAGGLLFWFQRKGWFRD